MNKYIRNSVIAFVGAAFTFTMLGAPLVSAHAPHKQETPKTTVRSYDMEDYLDMLLATGQYDKYARFAQIALPEAYARHSAHWSNGDPVRIVLNNPLQAAKVDAYKYGFDANADTFTLVSKNSNKAVVKIVHSGIAYYANMLKNGHSNWYINSVHRVSK
jgi:hypothetical protein